jgi:hypothetical protein
MRSCFSRSRRRDWNCIRTYWLHCRNHRAEAVRCQALSGWSLQQLCTLLHRTRSLARARASRMAGCATLSAPCASLHANEDCAAIVFLSPGAVKHAFPNPHTAAGRPRRNLAALARYRQYRASGRKQPHAPYYRGDWMRKLFNFLDRFLARGPAPTRIILMAAAWAPWKPFRNRTGTAWTSSSKLQAAGTIL